jgi:hypothetical protein
MTALPVHVPILDKGTDRFNAWLSDLERMLR